MKKLIFSAIIVAATAFIGCSKEESAEIPTSLNNSTWCSATDADTFEQTIVRFTDSENAIWSIIKKESGTNITLSEAEYSYTYKAPNITLSPKMPDNPTINGQMIKLDEDYIYLHLKSVGGAIDIRLTQMPDKDQTIWQ